MELELDLLAVDSGESGPLSTNVNTPYLSSKKKLQKGASARTRVKKAICSFSLIIVDATVCLAGRHGDLAPHRGQQST